jgi:hypothetical protein
VTTFALVHGAWHGAWCWERLVPSSSGWGTARWRWTCDDATVTFTTYADVVVEALDLARLLHEAG